jgi:hypothetical protein
MQQRNIIRIVKDIALTATIYLLYNGRMREIVLCSVADIRLNMSFETAILRNQREHRFLIYVVMSRSKRYGLTNLIFWNAYSIWRSFWRSRYALRLSSLVPTVKKPHSPPLHCMDKIVTKGPTWIRLFRFSFSTFSQFGSFKIRFHTVTYTPNARQWQQNKQRNGCRC